MTFILKKIITCAIIPPGLFIVLLLLFAVFLKKKSRFFALMLAALLYLGSIEPVANLLLIPLEDAYKPPTLAEVKAGNAYVVLGAGALDFAPDIDEKKGTLSSVALSRLVCAYRLYRIDKKPVILSGGKVFERRPEAEIAKRILLSLGVNEKDIFMEAKSRDTFENAKYVKALSETHNINRVVLITSAFHMKRSMIIFNNFFKGTIPCPTGHITSRAKYDPLNYLPNAGNLDSVGIALKEYIGTLFYKITL